MGQQLLQIQPGELRFTFELKKLSSCSMQLVNKSKDYVAFKVKTTSPKRYCVRPHTGIIQPYATCDFTVTMRAIREAPPDMQLNDKFLVQSTIVPFWTSDVDIVSSLFSKDKGRYTEEQKLRVVLMSPPCSPLVHPIIEALKEEPAYEAPVLQESRTSKDQALTGYANLLSSHVSTAYEDPVLKENPSSKGQELNGAQNHLLSHVARDGEDLRLQINQIEMKLNEADETIAKLMEEKSIAIQERETLRQEIVLLRRKCAARVQVGFPFFFVVFVALVSVTLGYLLHK